MTDTRMSPKAEAFLAALEALCREHGVQMSVSHYDAIQLWPLRGDEPPVHANGIEDRLEEPK